MADFQNKITDSEFIGKLIPQKSPFVMVDSLLHFEENKCVAGLTISKENILASETNFSAAGLIEHMAQSAALYTGYGYHLKNEPIQIGYIGSLNKVEIATLPKIGQTLETNVTILHEILNITVVSIETVCDGEVIGNAEIKVVLM